jgi:hypothetical protein
MAITSAARTGTVDRAVIKAHFDRNSKFIKYLLVMGPHFTRGNPHPL